MNDEQKNAALSVLALVAVGFIFGACVYWTHLPMLQTIFQTLPVVVFPSPPL